MHNNDNYTGTVMSCIHGQCIILLENIITCIEIFVGFNLNSLSDSCYIIIMNVP